MRHPKSTSHISGLIAFAGIALFAHGMASYGSNK